MSIPVDRNRPRALDLEEGSGPLTPRANHYADDGGRRCGGSRGALKPPSDDEVLKMLDAQGKASLEKLKASSGAEFDKAYVAGQLDGHKKLLTIQEDYLKVGQDREHLSVTKLARGQIKEHIDHLDMLMSKLG